MPQNELRFGAELRRAVADLLLATTFEGVWLIDKAGRTTFVNERVAALLAYSVDEMIGAPIFDFMDADARATAAENLARRQAGVAEQHEFKCRRKDGAPIWLLITANPVLDRLGGYAGSLALVADLSLQKERESNLRRENAVLEGKLAELSDAHSALMDFVNQDAPTGLHNRRYLEHRLMQEIARCTRYKRSLAVLFIDLDGFKGVNDRFGHSVGDQALCHITQLLQAPPSGVALLRTSDLAARIGGDEIVVVAMETDAKGGHTLARRLVDAMRRNPLVVADMEIAISASIGVASFPEHASSWAELLAVADAAMYCAKRLGGGRACVG